ncbi:tetratricopeptide repeat protein [Deinococcus navajonensis]|uniref:Tetratricopeptide repeat protein n=1 Tax=Deinococcus navajonensis TaxID=309884 RepID=A0ABV8XSE0_9DEIO
MLDLPPELSQYETRLPQHRDAQRVDAMLNLAETDESGQDQLLLAVHARTLALELADEARAARSELRLAGLLEGSWALEYARAARIRFGQLKDVPSEVRSALREAELLHDQPAEALTLCLVAAALAQEAGLPALAAQAWRRAGDLSRQMGGDTEAVEAYERALASAETPGPHVTDLPVLLALGALHIKAQRLEQALEVYRTAGRLAHQAGTVEQADALGGLGTAYGLQGDHERALKFLDKAAQLAAQREDHRRQTRYLNLMASAQDKLGDAAQARSLYEDSLAVARSAGLADVQAMTLLNLAEHSLRQDRPQEAEALLHEVLTLCRQAQLSSAERRAHGLMVSLARVRQDPATALTHQETSARLEHAALTSRHRRQVQLHKAMWQAEFELGTRRERLEADQRLQAALDETLERITELHAQADSWRDTSMFDAVSGARSRRFGTEQLELNFKRSLRAKTALSLAVVGVDLALDDPEGSAELQTDGVIRTVANLIGQTIRATDTVARFDARKFLVIFPETDVAGATLTLNRVLEALKAHDWEAQGLSAPASVSVGLASRGFLQWSQLLLEAADEEYYRARRSGNYILSVAE